MVHKRPVLVVAAAALPVAVFAWFGLLLFINSTAILLLLLAGGAAAVVMVSRLPKVSRALGVALSGSGKAAPVATVACALILPLLFSRSPYALHILVIACIQAIAVLGLNLQVGNAGLPNLGYAAFYGVGAYVSALLAVELQASFWIGLPCAVVVSALVGLVLGFPALRTKPVYLALVTIAFGLVLFNLFLNVRFLHGPDGVRGIPAPSVFGWSFFSSVRILGIQYPNQFPYYYLSLAFLMLALFVARLLDISPAGLTMNAIRENEIAARSIGIDVSAGKLMAFSVGSVFGGVAGALYAHYIGYISAQNFTLGVSFGFLAMVILGGSGNVMGVTVAAVLLTVLPEKFRALSDYRLLAYGVIIVTMLIFRPQGLIPERIRSYPVLRGLGRTNREDAT